MKITWRNFSKIALFSLIAFGTQSCGGSQNNTNTEKNTKDTVASVIIHNLGDPDKLNPLTSSSADATYIQSQIFSTLLVYDPTTLELAPYMAVSMPKITEINEGEFAGGMSIEFEIDPTATWDNGKPITAEDYVFTIKAVKNPKTNAAPQRPYLDFIDKIDIDANNPKKFTIFSRERYFLAESSAGGISILPEYVYDSLQLMRKFTIEELDNPKNMERLSINDDISRFADIFNSNKFDRDVVVGSGPYTFKKWETGQFITLERKASWWGDKSKNALVKAYAPSITYKMITDQKTAITQMENEDLDVMASIKPDDFVDLKEKKDFSRKFDLSTPDQFAYAYLGFNTKISKLADKRVRRAIAHLVNRDDIIESLYKGLAVKTNSPINPKKPYYDKTLPNIDFDPQKAQALLAEAGWKDTDGDGILDKTVNGKKETMTLSYKYNNGNNIRKNIGVLLKEEAKRVGVIINIEAREWTVFLEDNKKRDFELVSLAWVQSPSLDDLKQIWHTSADSPEGSNRVGFGNKESDALIDKIRVTLNTTERDSMYKKIQQIIHEEQPYVFLCVPSERISIHKRFQGRETSAARPGYSPHMLQLK
jgi:peptide/nickel transport system substrate-binding protein